MSETIEKKGQFDSTPEGWARRWTVELQASRDALEPWWKRGDKVFDRYLDDRKDDTARKRLNLFHGDIATKRALLYGNPPRVRCRRRHADADDDIARVSAEMLERILNTDIDKDGDGFVESLGLARDDRLLPGLGVVRARYTVEMEDVPEQPAQMGPCPACQGGMTTSTMGPCPQCNGANEIELAPAVPAGPRKKIVDPQLGATEEDVETDYTHWRSFLWQVQRVWKEVGWIAFEAQMTRDQLHERFDGVEWMGPERVEEIPLQSRRQTDDDKAKRDDPWSRASVWEIWNKDDRKVYWFVDGFASVLDIKDDPLGLSGFFPCPQPLMANVTSRKLVPVPDLAVAQDLYDEIDTLYDRIFKLTKACRVVGWYDRTYAGQLKALFDGDDAAMFPIEQFGALQEKGGLDALVAFFPTEKIAATIAVLSEKLREKIILKDQVTGIADIMRGGTTGGATATEQRIKARFGSTRIQAAQDEFARFTTDTQKIRAEIIAKHWDVGTIIERSNVMYTPDRQYAQQAAELIKRDAAAYRIDVASDTLAMTDYDAVQQERTGALMALGGYFQQAVPFVQMHAPGGPGAVLAATKLVQANAKWLIAGLRGANGVEAEFDKYSKEMETAAQQAQAAAAQPKPPDPKVEEAKIGLETKKFEAGAKVQQTKMDMQVKTAEHGMEMRKLAAETQAADMQSRIRMREASIMPEKEERPE